MANDGDIDPQLLQLHYTDSRFGRVDDLQVFEGTAGFTGTTPRTLVDIKHKHLTIDHAFTSSLRIFSSFCFPSYLKA
jgi:hypothetical protein